MVKLICDKCGKDCDHIGYDVQLGVLLDFSPYDKNDTASAKLTCDNHHLRMILCQECYIGLGLPNLYEQGKSKEVVWPDEEQK